jgi:hypothetical protein
MQESDVSPKHLRVMRRATHAIVLVAMSAWAGSASADPIVGTWVGKGNHTSTGSPFNMRLTFVSPKGGVSRYSDIPCGGKLAGGPSGDEKYEYEETILYNGPEERSENYCINGRMRLSVDGTKMTYEGFASHNGEDFSSTGQLQRER